MGLYDLSDLMPTIAQESQWILQKEVRRPNLDQPEAHQEEEDQAFAPETKYSQLRRLDLSYIHFLRKRRFISFDLNWKEHLDVNTPYCYKDMYLTNLKLATCKMKISMILKKLIRNTSCTASARRRLYPSLSARGLVSNEISAIPTCRISDTCNKL